MDRKRERERDIQADRLMLMNRLTIGQPDRWTDNKLRDRQTNIQWNRQTTNRQCEIQTDIQTEGQKDKQIVGQIDERMDR